MVSLQVQTPPISKKIHAKPAFVVQFPGSNLCRGPEAEAFIRQDLFFLLKRIVGI